MRAPTARPPDARPASRPEPAGLRPRWSSTAGALRAEWTKLWTLPGTIWLLTAIVALTVAVSAAAIAATRCPPGNACPVDTARLSLTGIQFGQAVAILAVLAVSGEYSTGMVRVTFTAIPAGTRCWPRKQPPSPAWCWPPG